MDIDLAISIIIQSFNNAIEGESLEFDFHGGEIALAFNEIKYICEWTWSRAWKNDYVFHATTNGTLIHGNIKEWFSNNHYRFSLGLSLDGTSEMHNKNRSNSYSFIDLPFFLKSWPNQSVKMTISPLTISSVDKGIIDIVEKGFKLTANLAYGQKWEGAHLRKEYRLALSRLVEYYLSNPELEVCNLIGMNLSEIGKKVLLNLPNTHKKWCGCGENMKCYSIDGKTYPCQMFNPSSNKFQDSNILDNLPINNIPVNGCEMCDMLPSCPSCYGYGFITKGEISKAPDELCDFRKIEAFASSYIYGCMLQNPTKYKTTRGLTNNQIACITMGIKTIQTNYKDFVFSF